MARRLAIHQKKWLLSVHILLSVGWFGTALCFMVLGIVAAGTRDENVLRVAYTGIELLDRTLVRPLAIGTAATGVLLSLLTRWGLFRFYWLIAKEVFTALLIGAGVILFGAIRVSVALVAGVASAGSRAQDNPAFQSSQSLLLGYVALEVVLLAALVVLSVFKPFRQRGEQGERYGRRPMNMEEDRHGEERLRYGTG